MLVLLVSVVVSSWVPSLSGTSAPTGRMCTAFSLGSTVVQLGSTLELYCTFSKRLRDRCAKALYLNQKQIQSTQEILAPNGTTLFARVGNVTGDVTLACNCKCTACTEPCGLVLVAGYPPEVPDDLQCFREGLNGSIICSWKPGREPYLHTISRFWFRNCTSAPISISPSSPTTVVLPNMGWQCMYTVWVTMSNRLGEASSSKLNFTPQEIVIPLAPTVTAVTCGSSSCVVRWMERHSSLQLQVQYRSTTGRWRNVTVSANSHQSCNISTLDAYTEYEFQVRSKLNRETRLWSKWSTKVRIQTEEAAPAKQVDLWYTEDLLDESYTVVWKELSTTDARGRILGYKVKVEDLHLKRTIEHVTLGLSSWSLNCTRCNVTVSAFNSKGASPAAFITLPMPAEACPQSVSCQSGNLSIAISWQRPNSSVKVLAYLVEWLPDGDDPQKVNWRKVPAGQLRTVITDIDPQVCYNGTVYALYASGAGRKSFQNLCSRHTVPQPGPNPVVKIWGNRSITVSWSVTRKNCYRSFFIYLGRGGATCQKLGPVAGSKYTFTTVLVPGEYELWMTGWSTAGDGPHGAIQRFIIEPQDDSSSMLPTVVAITTIVCFGLLCLYRFFPLRQRFSAHICPLHQPIPDPANSKWAKEYASLKGELLICYNFSLESSQDDPEPPGVEIQVCGTSNSHENGLPAGTPIDITERQDLASPSHKHKPHSADYIASHWLQEKASGEDEEEQLENFFPCPQSPFSEPLLCKGELTLDAVKMTC